MEKTALAAQKTELALIVFASEDMEKELEWFRYFQEKKTPVIPVVSKSDLRSDEENQEFAEKLREQTKEKVCIVSAKTGAGIAELKEWMIRMVPEGFGGRTITGDLVSEGEVVLLVMPQDIQAPKGRLILPQVQTMILGHNNQEVLNAVIRKAESGLSFGAATEIEVEMAEFICENIPSIEMIRMVNSGTEAVMSAIRAARGYTGRNKIVKFAGCYHGHSDALLVKAGSGVMTAGIPDSAGVPAGATQDTLTAVYNNLESVKMLFEENEGQIAAVIVEPVAANMGVVLPKEGFLKGLRELCTNHGAVLIFDEVITGFRLAFGGAQERFGIEADLVTYGKIIGAGMPVGAFGGKREIMEVIAPVGHVYQAGTLSGNPVAMAAGLTQLKILKNHPEIYTHMSQMGEKLYEGMKELVKKYGSGYLRIMWIRILNILLHHYDRRGRNAGEVEKLLQSYNLPDQIQSIQEIRQKIVEMVMECVSTESVTDANARSKIQMAVGYIQEHFGENLTVNDLAEHYEMSPNYFSSMFKKEMSRSAVNYITELRINQARELLYHSELSVVDISKKVGYEDSQYFFRVFKKYLGMTPLQYREESRK